MSETIRLPCGVQAVVEFRPSQDPLLRDSWHVAVRGFMGVVDYDRDSAIKWLNEKCVEARAALLPPGARIVEDTPETRETIARALVLSAAGRKMEDLTASPSSSPRSSPSRGRGLCD